MPKMKLESAIAKREGKKSQVTIGNIREVIRAMVDLMAEQYINEESDAYLEEFINRIDKRESQLVKAKKAKRK